MYSGTMTSTNPDKIADRIRKLLELSHSTNEHEAATAGARAAEMMSEHNITEAMLQVVDADDAAQAETRAREGIVEQGLPEQSERKIAWRDRIADAVAKSFDCQTLYWNNNLQAIGRESNVQGWRYTCQYLFSEVARLADEAWLQDGADLAAVGQRPRAWKGAFRLGAADTVANRLYLQRKERDERERAGASKAAALLSDGSAAGNQLALVRTDRAIAILEKDRAEVLAAFKKRTEGWKKTGGLGRSQRTRSGYRAGREAGEKITLGGARAALKE